MNMSNEEYNRLQELLKQRLSLFDQMGAVRTPIQNQLDSNWQEILTLRLKCKHEWLNAIRPEPGCRGSGVFFDSPYCKHCHKTYY